MTNNLVIHLSVFTVFVASVVGFYALLNWLVRRSLDPESLLKDLPLPGFLRLSMFISALILPVATAWFMLMVFRIVL